MYIRTGAKPLLDDAGIKVSNPLKFSSVTLTRLQTRAKVSLIGELAETRLDRSLQIKLAHVQTNADSQKKGRLLATSISPDFCELSSSYWSTVQKRIVIKNHIFYDHLIQQNYK